MGESMKEELVPKATLPSLPEGIVVRVVGESKKLRYVAQLRVGGKRVSKTFSLIENALGWLKEKKLLRRAEQAPKDLVAELVCVYLPKEEALGASSLPQEKVLSEKALMEFAPQRAFAPTLFRIDAMQKRFFSSPDTLTDQEFILVYWGVQELSRKPNHFKRYKQIISEERQLRCQERNKKR